MMTVMSMFLMMESDKKTIEEETNKRNGNHRSNAPVPGATYYPGSRLACGCSGRFSQAETRHWRQQDYLGASHSVP
jgi:hypothetical protein